MVEIDARALPLNLLAMLRDRGSRVGSCVRSLGETGNYVLPLEIKDNDTAEVVCR